MECFKRIVHHAEIMGGKPCIRGTRVTVGLIVSLIETERSIESILDDYPYLVEEDVRQALRYAAWKTEERT